MLMIQTNETYVRDEIYEFEIEAKAHNNLDVLNVLKKKQTYGLCVMKFSAQIVESNSTILHNISSLTYAVNNIHPNSEEIILNEFVIGP